MSTRTRTHWKPDKSGQFTRQVGWKKTSSGKRSQHKFRLGTDSILALQRDQLLKQMWHRIELAQPENPMWTEDTLFIAMQVAKGNTYIEIAPNDEDKLDGDSIYVHAYCERIYNLCDLFPMLKIYPQLGFSNDAEYEKLSPAKKKEAEQIIFVLRSNAWDDIEGKFYDEQAARTEDEKEILFLKHFRGEMDAFASLKEDTSIIDLNGPKLHEAMQSYIGWIEKEYTKPASEIITPWGWTKIKQVKTLIERHDNVFLAGIDYHSIEELYRFWRQRPSRKGSDQPIAKKSAENLLTALKDFFKWLHKSQDYDWRKPEDFEDIKSTIVSLPEENRPQVTADVLFTLDELILLNKYATPLQRLFLLLGLNCGFGRAEIATIQVDELFIDYRHEKHHQELLNFKEETPSSFIRRVRRKSRVYGEFILFDQTEKAARWALKNRKKQANFGPNARLLLNQNEESYDKPSKSGNANQQISNRFSNLLNKIRADGNEIRNLSFGKLRKTAGDLIRRFSDGEVSAVFLCHGQPVGSDELADVYTSRPFGKVFTAIRQVEDYLQPMFEAAGSRPF